MGKGSKLYMELINFIIFYIIGLCGMHGIMKEKDT